MSYNELVIYITVIHSIVHPNIPLDEVIYARFELDDDDDDDSYYYYYYYSNDNVDSYRKSHVP